MCSFIPFQIRMDFYFFSKWELVKKGVQCTENEKQPKENNNVGVVLQWFQREQNYPEILLPGHAQSPAASSQIAV